MKFCAALIVLLCAMLWAKPNVCIPAVELDGVHQDYADKLVRLTKESLTDKNEVRIVECGTESDFVLQIKMQSWENGIVVVYSLLDSDDKDVIWTYKHMAYTPEDLAPIADLVVNTKKFEREGSFKLGVGLGAIGFAAPEFAAAPSVDLVANYLRKNFLLSLDVNWGFDEGLGDDFSYLGAFLSAAYVFDGRTISPFVGPGAGLIYLDYDSEKYKIDEAPEGFAFFLKTGVLFKPVDYKTVFALDVRYLYNFCNLEKKSDDGYNNAHGWSASVQVWW